MKMKREVKTYLKIIYMNLNTTYVKLKGNLSLIPKIIGFVKEISQSKT